MLSHVGELISYLPHHTTISLMGRGILTKPNMYKEMHHGEAEVRRLHLGGRRAEAAG